MIKEADDLIIRNFQPSDLKQVAEIIASSFREDLLKLVSLSEDQMVDFLIETGEVFPYPFSGYFVVEKHGEILGLMMPRWPKQTRPKARLRVSKALHYGWLTTLKVLVMRYIFSEKPSKGACHVTEIAVKQQARRKGIGTRLLNYGKEIALRNGLTRYTLHVDATNNTAFNLYRRLGFKIVKRQRSLLARWLLDVKEWYFMSQDVTLPM